MKLSHHSLEQGLKIFDPCHEYILEDPRLTWGLYIASISGLCG